MEGISFSPATVREMIRVAAEGQTDDVAMFFLVLAGGDLEESDCWTDGPAAILRTMAHNCLLAAGGDEGKAADNMRSVLSGPLNAASLVILPQCNLLTMAGEAFRYRTDALWDRTRRIVDDLTPEKVREIRMAVAGERPAATKEEVAAICREVEALLAQVEAA